MSLSLELCKELKAAGFPQGTFAARDAWSWLGDIWLLVSGYMPDNPDRVDEYACPNSDELIAQIQAEWPNCVGFHCFTSCWDWWAAFELEVQKEPQEIVELQGGGTPHLAEALARLYIALREQT